MKKILISVGLYFIKVALLENNQLLDFYIEERKNKSIVGNIYRGKVTNVLPGMQSIFVDVGMKKDVFMYVGDFQKTPDFLDNDWTLEQKNNAPLIDLKKLFHVGNDIIVQIIKEPISTKGARGIPHISIPGHFMVLMPQDKHIGISKRIDDSKERNRLKSFFSMINKQEVGIILRTAAAYRSEEELEREFLYLYHEWEKICDNINNSKPRSLIYTEASLPLKTVRDLYNSDIEEILIDDAEEMKSINDFITFIDPENKEKVKFFNSLKEGISLFDKFNVSDAIDSTLKTRVNLKNRSYLIIEHTEALTAIDVNSGSFVGKSNLEDTVFEVNKSAALEIARHLKIRDIGGIIIIDFIDMRKKENQHEIVRILKESFANDKAPVSIKGITDFGLVEMTRKKVKSPIIERLTDECPHCSGTGKIKSKRDIFDKIYLSVKSKKEFDQGKVIVSPMMYEFISSNKLLKSLNAISKCRLFLKKDPGFKIEQFEIL